MTVAELIKELEKMPQDYSVVFFIDSDECFPPICDNYDLATMKITECDDGEEAACIEDGFEFGAAYMLGRVEDWLRKIGKGQLIGSLNRFLKEKDNEPNKEIYN